MSRKKKSREKQKPNQKAKRKRVEIDASELKEILNRAKSAPLSPEDYDTLHIAVATLTFLTMEIEAKGASIARLRNLLFGPRTEKTTTVLGQPSPTNPGPPADNSPNDAGAAPDDEKGTPSKEKRKGHGRIGVAAYFGATKVKVTHPSACRGDNCPECLKGKVYPLAEPARLIRVKGVAPLSATIYECDQLRCNLCGEVFTAPPPDGLGNEKYDETASSMIGLLKYGTGMPFNRLEKLQDALGIPLPAGTQWELVEEASKKIRPTFDELVRQAAQGKLLHNDDTTMKVLKLTKAEREDLLEESKGERSGVFTSSILSTLGGQKIALFFTGPKHAGENLSDVLKHRSRELTPPIQMSDALSRNTPDEFNTIQANCIAHARRNFVEVVDNFPEECRHVLETLREVYKNDAETKKAGLSDDARLSFHQERSGPLMEDLEKWMQAQVDERKVEPNSGLGQAIAYMQNHWAKLTLFLRVPGAPLDNNICERALKKAILHRKNALFYRTLNGALVGDIFMSLIHTAELNGVDPFDYLVALQRNYEDVHLDPAAWMPWNYKLTIPLAA